jgi:hypothetical protein
MVEDRQKVTMQLKASNTISLGKWKRSGFRRAWGLKNAELAWWRQGAERRNLAAQKVADPPNPWCPLVFSVSLFQTMGLSLLVLVALLCACAESRDHPPPNRAALRRRAQPHPSRPTVMAVHRRAPIKVGMETRVGRRGVLALLAGPFF